jgi:hypothetical protein
MRTMKNMEKKKTQIKTEKIMERKKAKKRKRKRANEDIQYLHKGIQIKINSTILKKVQDLPQKQ